MMFDSLQNALKDRNTDIGDFQRVIWRLMSHQVIYAEQTQIERELYHLFERMDEVIDDYLRGMGFRIYHDRSHHYVVLFSPGANSPVIESDDMDEVRGLRRTLNQEEVSLFLVLRVLYEHAVKQGAIADDGKVKVSVEEVNTSYKTFLRRNPPQGVLRTETFRTLANLRVVGGQGSVWDDPEGWLTVTPVIVSLVFADLLRLLDEGLSALDDDPLILIQEQDGLEVTVESTDEEDASVLVTDDVEPDFVQDKTVEVSSESVDEQKDNESSDEDPKDVPEQQDYVLSLDDEPVGQPVPEGVSMFDDAVSNEAVFNDAVSNEAVPNDAMSNDSSVAAVDVIKDENDKREKIKPISKRNKLKDKVSTKSSSVLDQVVPSTGSLFSEE